MVKKRTRNVRIGFDVSPLCVPHSGVGTYTSNLLCQLQTLGDEVVPLFHRPPLHGCAGGASDRTNGTPPFTRKYLNKTLWMQCFLPLQLSRLGVSVGHFTNSVAPLLSPCPTVITIHDMTLWLFPQYHNSLRLLSMRPFIPMAARRAAAIVAVSRATKQDLVRILRVPPEKVHVIHEAPAASFHPMDRETALNTMRQSGMAPGMLPDRFALYVGTIEPRKNLVRLLQAFAQLWHGGVVPHKLLFVGQRGWKEEPVFRAVEQLGLQEAVLFLGYVPHETLIALYNLAEALVFPSLYEGFGLPVVEAMACGTPVITSRNGSLGEVTGGAAEFVEPTSTESIAEALRYVLNDPDRQAELRQRGLAQSSRFSWEISAKQTQAVYRQVAGRQ
ncbi:MAG: glycosyltransferase family 1 protein [Chloroflexi bacterium]|nr:MAG: glycosyltransferase family 1 protein [Chloroflexota bacterium]